MLRIKDKLMQWIRKTLTFLFDGTVRHATLAGAGAFVLAAGVIYLLAGEIYDYHDTVDPQNPPAVDAIVCLGGGRGRITAAGDLWYRYLEKVRDVKNTPVLYLSGMGPQTNWTLLSRQLRPAILQKIRPESIVIEKESSNTDANAQWLARYAEQQHWRRVLLLTSSYHMKRAKYIFDQVLRGKPLSIELETLSVSQEPFTSRDWRSEVYGIRVTLWEYLKWVYYHSVWKPGAGI